MQELGPFRRAGGSELPQFPSESRLSAASAAACFVSWSSVFRISSLSSFSAGRSALSFSFGGAQLQASERRSSFGQIPFLSK